MGGIPIPPAYTSYDTLTAEGIFVADIQARIDQAQAGANKTYQDTITMLYQLLSTIDMNAVWNIVQQGLTPVELQLLSNPFPMTPPIPVDRPTFLALPPLPTMPAMPTLNLDLFSYDSPLLDLLVAQLTNDIQTGGYGTSAPVQAADMALNQLRRDALNLLAMDNATAGYAARGWRLPQGAHVGIEQEIRNQEIIAATESSDKITIESFNLAQKDRWEAWKDAIEVERLRSGLILEAAKTAVIIFQAELEYIKTFVTLALAEATIVTEYNKDLVEIYEADTKVYEVVIQALVAQFGALLAQNKEQADIAIKMDDIAERAGTTLYGVQKELIKSVAQIFSQIVASWLSSAQIGLSGAYHEARQDSTSASVESRVSGSGSIEVREETSTETRTSQETITYT